MAGSVAARDVRLPARTQLNPPEVSQTWRDAVPQGFQCCHAEKVWAFSPGWTMLYDGASVTMARPWPRHGWSALKGFVRQAKKGSQLVTDCPSMFKAEEAALDVPVYSYASSGSRGAKGLQGAGPRDHDLDRGHQTRRKGQRRRWTVSRHWNWCLAANEAASAAVAAAASELRMDDLSKVAVFLLVQLWPQHPSKHQEDEEGFGDTHAPWRRGRTRDHMACIEVFLAVGTLSHRGVAQGPRGHWCVCGLELCCRQRGVSGLDRGLVVVFGGLGSVVFWSCGSWCVLGPIWRTLKSGLVNAVHALSFHRPNTNLFLHVLGVCWVFFCVVSHVENSVFENSSVH